MPNSLTSTGLTIATQSELQESAQTAFKTIYGPNINIGPETPDGQIINIPIQAALDLEELLMTTYNTFDPDNAIGTILDQRVALNGIQRQAGTFTVTNITLVLSQSVNLYGLDQTTQSVFTVADNAGNQYQLQTTQLGVGPGTVVYAFQAAIPGAITPVPNSITVPVTIVLGVTSINNPTTYTTLGVNEESDAALKIRRQISVSLPSQGYFQGLEAALENINGVTYAYVEENNTGTTNGDGVPGHSIWVIVAGSGAASSIAQAIYTKRNAGCGMYAPSGASSYTITQVDGSLFTVYWSDVTTQNLFIRFEVTSLNQTSAPNISAILNSTTGLPGIFTPGPAAEVNINQLSTLVQSIDPNTLVTNSGFSTTVGGSYTATLTPSQKNYQFIVSAADIIITPMYISSINTVLAISGSTITATLAIAASGTQQFASNGGYGTMTWSFDSHGSSGSTINSSTGAYVAGSAGTDVVRVTDSDPSGPNYATITITVT